ncbi:E3 ubiquitin/ISG15 ligase TRIM25-like [Sardina pilchardus]|uniref:E3 ubiquitin/ISG15 ligase TRIM25-like n=1 Tax=Sardina pilchardus TaxID=27697 RepID=UPI002E0FCFDB
MADAFLKEQDSFFCPICLDLLRDPVAIPCGHNYCMGCISSYWDQDEQRGCYSCPQCRQTSPQRPVLNKNPLIAQLVDRVRARLTTAPSARRYFHPGQVRCEFCSGDKRRSVRRCAADAGSSDSASGCRASGEVRPVDEHDGLDAVEQLRDNISSHRKKLLEIFCRSHQQCLCHQSPADEHKGLQVAMTTEETTGKQRHFHKYHDKSHQRIQEREKELQELKKAVETLKLSAQAAVEESESIYSDLLRSIERRAEEKAKLQLAQELLRRLQEEVGELRKETRPGQRSLSYHTAHIPQVLMGSYTGLDQRQ